MTVFEREHFADFLTSVIQLREAKGRIHEVHSALLEGRRNDEEAVAALATSPDEAVRTRKSLRTIHSDFPYGSAIAEQSAYLLRAFIGIDPFGDNDDEIAWAYLHAMLENHAWVLEASIGDQREYADALRLKLTVSYPSGFQRRHVLDRDEIFSGIVDWFDSRIQPADGDSYQQL